LIEVVLKCLNAFPSKGCISDTLSPSMILEGKPNPDMSKKHIVFGSYAMVFVGSDNTMSSRGIPALALNQSNEHGGHYFMSLYTGKRLHSYDWKELPIDDDVINQVEQLAQREKAKRITDKYPLFEWAPGMPIIDELLPVNNDNDIAEIIDDNSATDDSSDDNNDDIPVDDDDNNEIDNDDALEVPVNIDERIFISEDEGTTGSDDSDSTPDDETDDDSVMHDDDAPLETIAEDVEENDNSDIPAEMNDGSPLHVENKERSPESNDEFDFEERAAPAIENEERDTSHHRPQRAAAGRGIDRLQMSFDGKTYKHGRERQFLMMKEKCNVKKDVDRYYIIACNVMFTQMSAKKGIKMFGKHALAAMLKEYKQMDQGPMPGKSVFGPIAYEDLTKKEKREALEAVNLIKRKRCGKLKGRTCANGSKQRKYLKIDETVYSPTCTTEGLITTLVVDAMEERDIAIFDVQGAYLQTKMPQDKNVILVIRDEFVDILCEVNPEYKKHVRIVNGRKVLYVRILRAIYGCIESAMLWYNLYSSTLEGMGFKLNPYDKCVANKMIDGKQCTIVFYVDDNKLSHKDPKVVTTVMKEIEKHFGELVISRGKSHDFLGMNVTIRKDKKVSIDQHQQVEEVLKDFGPTGTRYVSSPCASHLWKTRDDAKMLSEQQAEKFHSTVAKLLYITKRSRPDIETAVAFLTTRVSKSDEDDWKKLKRVMTWLKQTKNDVRIIGAQSVKELFTWVDAAYAVHNNMRSQTGGNMSFGYGMIHCRSNKQKLNTKSSTEAEVVGTSDYVPFAIWLALFMREQGYDIEKSILFQDNESAIKMERNGKDSTTGRSRHIDIRHFFVKDRVDKREIEIEHCPTELMIADYFTKPLQGKQFKHFRDLIMGYKHISEVLSSIRLASKERVERKEKERKSMYDKSNTTKSKSYKQALLGSTSKSTGLTRKH
jgi:hypothetical protein